MKARINGSDPVDVTAYTARSRHLAETNGLPRWNATVEADLSGFVGRVVAVTVLADSGDQTGEGVVTSAVFDGRDWSSVVEGDELLTVLL